ncbi:uncharacterized protein RCC_05478 [Ramularia collo-cygni]|uniref:Uncharacterized protein n=1 Tax=Ramularia collo-cygni TaxID=112498 RepID=A0A2D3UWA2_9PEZI|nr:uncharacterized protein RCC_05478 [Ramularia collo-cygni]CZT19628.1 uncharacterized protein RCC_05478 [Ramularia collo-cygni]
MNHHSRALLPSLSPRCSFLNIQLHHLRRCILRICL